MGGSGIDKDALVTKIIYWGPYSGAVGTIGAQVNSASAMREFGGHDVALVRAHSEYQGMEALLENKNIRLLDLGLGRLAPRLAESGRFARRPYMLLVAFLGIAPFVRLLRRERPDVVVLSLLVVPALLAIRMSRVPVCTIVSIQGYPQFLGRPGIGGEPLWKRWENGLRRALWKMFYPAASQIAAMTEGTREKLVSQLDLAEDSVRVVPNPVVDEKVTKAAAAGSRNMVQRGSPWSIVGVGRLSYQKGFDVLLRAVAIMRHKGIYVNLILVGEGEQRQALESLAHELDVADVVEFAGYQPDPYPFMRNADLFVLSSRWEDPGHAVIEAAALRTPIVTTDCPSGPSELIDYGRGGWLCRVDDPKDMAEKIMDALRSPDEGKLDVAWKLAQKYTLQSHYERMQQLLDDCGR